MSFLSLRAAGSPRLPAFSLFVVVVAFVASAACGQTAARSSDGEQAVLANDPAHDGGDGPAPPPSAGPRIVGIKALGTGCPNTRTWTATIADDGQSASLDLRGYDVTVSHGDGVAVRDCAITMQVGSASGYAYTLGSFDSAGFASLRGDGVTGEESVKVYVQGSPLASESRLKSFAPADGGGDYTFVNPFGDDTAVWSPCGGGRDINIQSRLVLRNNADKSGQGYLKPATVRLQLHAKSCS